MIYLTFFTKRLIADIGYTEAQAGRLFMILGWASLPCGLIWGYAADAIGRKARDDHHPRHPGGGLRFVRPVDGSVPDSPFRLCSTA